MKLGTEESSNNVCYSDNGKTLYQFISKSMKRLCSIFKNKYMHLKLGAATAMCRLYSPGSDASITSPFTDARASLQPLPSMYIALEINGFYW